MKKALCKFVVCLLLVVVPFSALAEVSFPEFDGRFSVRNGITFGMSIDDVAKAEKAQLSSHGDFYLQYNNLTLMTMENVALRYFFNSQQTLCGFAYDTDTYDFDTLKDTLSTKYGEPQIIGELLSKYSTPIWEYDFCHAIGWLTRGTWNADELYADIRGSFSDGSGYMTDYAPWYIKYDDGYLVIELVESVNKYTGLGYCFITKEQMDDWLAEVNQTNQEILDSFMNDI